MANSYIQAYVYYIFTVKGRSNFLLPQHNNELQKYITGLAQNRKCKMLAVNNMPDHVHMCLSIPPKYSVSTVVGFLKGKSAISIAKNFKGRQRNFNGEAFWARGYYVSTVGLDEDMVKEYIRNQEKNDVHRDQLNIGI